MVFADDKDETLYYASTPGVGPEHRGELAGSILVFGTRRTTPRNPWAGASLSSTTTAMAKPARLPGLNEPPDPKLDREVRWSNGYGVAVNPVDGSVWYAGLGYPVPGESSAW